MTIDPERLDYSTAEYREFRLKIDLFPDEAVWFFTLLDAIKSFLHGEGDEFNPKMTKRSDDAKDWIFGKQDFQFCFNEVWLMFSDIDPGQIKEVLRYRLEYKKESHKKRRVNAENENHNGGRGAEAGSHNGNRGDSCQPREDGWIESILFQRDF